MKYIIGTRGSKLAMTQADSVRVRLAEAYPDHEFEIRVIRTTGDQILNKPLHEIGGKGVFVREIEEELLNHKADIGVHSMKDMPSCPGPGLVFARAWKREDPRDTLVLREKMSLEELPEGAVIGTGSRRREFQLKRLRPDIQVAMIRGNVDTRLRKMEEQRLDGLILAAAGLKRLGLERRITRYFSGEEMIPAPAQGVLALEVRREDKELLAMLDGLCDEETARAVEGERGFLREMGGDCHVPVGAYCRKMEDGRFFLRAMFGNETGSRQGYAAVWGHDPKALAKEAAVNIRRQMAGTVYLVGAGPGDPKLITVKGLRTVREADCIVYDRLIAAELLEEAKPGCEFIYVGKESSNHTMAQEQINALLARKSMEYRKVARLKGGDVYVFGRGGEEGLYLAERGISFEVIPGVTSAVAGPAFAGIPVTHRGMAGGFHVVTAHNQRDKLAEIDFQAMAKGKDTCIFLMGLSKVKEIAAGLMDAGMPGSTEAAVISWATTKKQKVCTSDLEHIGEAVAEARLVSPAMIVVGQVVSLRDKLGFFDRKPLFGRSYLIPKIGRNRTRLRELLEEKGADVDEIQVGEINYRTGWLDIEKLGKADWILFTSKNGVEAFFREAERSRLDLRVLAGCKIGVIGKKTAEELGSHGLYADLTPKEFHSEGLGRELRKHLTSGERVWYLKAGNGGEQLREELGDACGFEETVVYENREAAADLGKVRPLGEYDGILMTCASSAERFLDAAGEQWGEWKRIYSIGPKTTACLRRRGIERSVEAGECTYEGVVEAVLRGKEGDP